MGKLIRSDFYKILRTKYLYVCAIFSALMAMLIVYAEYFVILQTYGDYASLFSLDSISAIMMGTPSFISLAAIAIAMFVSSDFNYGTIKNVISSGVSRIKIYFSKVIVSFTITFFYALISCVTSFIMGSVLWEVGEYTRDVYINLIKSLSFSLFASFALISVYIMIGFLVRNSGIAIAVNLGTYYIVMPLLIKFVNVAVATWFKISEFNLSDYLASTYVSKVLNFNELASQEITTGLIVCGSYILLSTVIGLVTFKRRDIK